MQASVLVQKTFSYEIAANFLAKYELRAVILSLMSLIR